MIFWEISVPTIPYNFKNRAKRKFPQLDNDNFKYVQCFYEGMHNDARTCLSMALTAIQHGALCLNYVEMVEVIYDKNEGVPLASDAPAPQR